MKVYAEFIEEDGLQYRTKTLLQLGDSWDLIGSIMMKNPGSAFPNRPIDDNEEAYISKFYNSEIDRKNWFEFKPDMTMHKIKPIFSGAYVGQQKELNGVIQIFNLFNIREKNISIAKDLANNSSSKFLFPDINETINMASSKPIYLGFHWEYVKKENDNSNYKMNVNRIANEIFNYVKNSKFMYMKNDIIDNFMFHPLSPKINNEKYSDTLKKFISLYD